MDTAKIGIEGYKSVNDYVDSKLKKFKEMGISFETLFSLMFSEGNNIMYERSQGYRIQTTTYQEAKRQTLCRAKTLAQLLKASAWMNRRYSQANCSALLWVRN